MPHIYNFQRAFNGGEISESMYGRIDDGKYQTGLAKCKNFIIETQGALSRRPGFEYVNAAKFADKKCRLIPFNFSLTQTIVLEFGEKYIRFHHNGATVMDGESAYEVATDYTVGEVFDIHYVQSADVLTLVHPNHPPMELRRYGATNWTLQQINFGSSLSAPVLNTVTQHINSSVTNPTDYHREYCVTALLADGTAESSKSNTVGVDCNPYGDGAYNEITWSAVDGAGLYRVYRNQGGVWAYIGQTTGTSIIDERITPDASITPPIYDAVFNSAGNYPGAVSYFEQRRWFGGTLNRPNNIWATKSGTESMMAYSLPTQDDDRIAVRVAAREANRIQHIAPLSQLMLLTGAAEWRVSPVNSDAITPSSMSVRPQSYIGSNGVQPLVVNSAMLFAAARGGHIRECGYNWQASGFVSSDVCLRAPHLFDDYTITDMTYAQAPWPIAFIVSSSGKLIAYTYVPEQGVGAFSTIETSGEFESCCAIAEGVEDRLYAVVKRTINGATVRFIERMSEQHFSDLASCNFLDCSGFYEGDATTTVSGLSWLEGETVSILADGSVEPDQVVKDGKIKLSFAAKTVRVGLPFQSDIKTLPVSLALQDGSFGSSHRKNVRSVSLRVVESSGIEAGPDFDNLSEYPARGIEFAGSPPDLTSEEVLQLVAPAWSDSGEVCVRQRYPLPLRIISITESIEAAV